MRVLVGLVKDVQPERVVPSFRDVHFRHFKQTGKTLRQILYAWRDTWTPDLVLLGAVPFLPMPCDAMGPEAPPLAFYLDDWHHNLASCLEACEMAEVILTDPRGVQVLQRHGCDRAVTFTRQHYHADFDRPDGHGDPEHDICFAGTIDDPIYQRRSRLFPILAGFADRYRVRIVGKIFGDAYRASITGSRIALNHSIRGELNRRTYEILSAGRVLLMESENDEGRLRLRDGDQCVFYTEDTLAERLQWLLDHPDECERIGRQGQAWARQFPPEQRLESLVAHLAAVDPSRPQHRRWAAMPQAERGRILAMQALAREPDDNALLLAEGYLTAAEQDDGRNLRVQHGLAVCALHRAQATPLPEARRFWLQRACRLLQQLTTARPQYVLAWITLGFALDAAGEAQQACMARLQALQALERQPYLPATDFLTHLSRATRYEWNRALALGLDLANLVGTTLATWIGTQLTDGEPMLAAAMLGRVGDAPYDLADYWWQVSRNQARQGLVDGTLAAGQKAVSLAPLNFGWRESLIETALEVDRIDEAVEWMLGADMLLQAGSDEGLQQRLDPLKQRLELARLR